MRKPVVPIERAVQAKPHTPVYRMHRYFARRPPTLFAELVRHYTERGDLVLDPFCGGGVTLVEGQLQGRRVVGFDINPLATFVTRMELADVDLDGLEKAQNQVIRDFRPFNDQFFATHCRECQGTTPALWFEHSALAVCENCTTTFSIADAVKKGLGRWACPQCHHPNRFAPNAQTKFKCISLAYSCSHCGHREVTRASGLDQSATEQVAFELAQHERSGLLIPNEPIPDCNMQRESALFKKDIRRFRQLFTPRHLLALALLRQVIVSQHSPFEEWLLFSFSSTLRYTNRMVTRNPSWRGERPLEWVKPGFWLPPVHLEANVLEEFSRRGDAVLRGKRDYLSSMPTGRRPRQSEQVHDVLAREGATFHVSTSSATRLPLPDESVETIITDPPYGSYIHYADLCNFWSVWLPGIEGLGGLINDQEEAVIARKSFPGAKSAADYQRILERSFVECARVLRPDGYMVLTFHNREPRAWAALLVAAVKAGFDLAPNGLLFQDGIQSYRHTAQSRRSGSVIGDFVLSFRKSARPGGRYTVSRRGDNWITPGELLKAVDELLGQYGPLAPDVLLYRLYQGFCPRLVEKVRAAIAEGDGALDKLIKDFDAIQVFDSHRRHLLEEHFDYREGVWCRRNSDGNTKDTSAS